MLARLFKRLSSQDFGPLPGAQALEPGFLGKTPLVPRLREKCSVLGASRGLVKPNPFMKSPVVALFDNQPDEPQVVKMITTPNSSPHPSITPNTSPNADQDLGEQLLDVPELGR